MGLPGERSIFICLDGGQSIQLDGQVYDVVQPSLNEDKDAAVSHFPLASLLQPYVVQLVVQ